MNDENKNKVNLLVEKMSEKEEAAKRLMEEQKSLRLQKQLEHENML